MLYDVNYPYKKLMSKSLKLEEVTIYSQLKSITPAVGMFYFLSREAAMLTRSWGS